MAIVTGFRRRHVIERALAQALVTVLALVWLVPVLMMVTVSLMPANRRTSILAGLIVDHPTLANYAKVWTENPLPRYFLNSLIITVPTVLLVLAIASLAAFAFTRLRFFGQGIWYYLLMLTLMVPIPTLVIPLFKIAKSLRILDTYWGLIGPYTALGVPFAVVILTGFFRRFPREIEDAARLDGCSSFGVFWRIMLPLSWPALAVVFIWQFMVSWNEFILALVMMQTESRKPLIMVPMIYNGV